MKVRIRDGAHVHIDFRVWRWPNIDYGDTNLEFEAQPAKFDSSYLELKAHKFGLGVGKDYGNGSVYAKCEDVIQVEGKG